MEELFVCYILFKQYMKSIAHKKKNPAHQLKNFFIKGQKLRIK